MGPLNPDPRDLQSGPKGSTKNPEEGESPKLVAWSDRLSQRGVTIPSDRSDSSFEGACLLQITRRNLDRIVARHYENALGEEGDCLSDLALDARALNSRHDSAAEGALGYHARDALGWQAGNAFSHHAREQVVELICITGLGKEGCCTEFGRIDRRRGR